MYEPEVNDILDPATGEVVDHCAGPTTQGSCPLATGDGIVLCQGCRIASASAGPEYWNLWVPPATRHCPKAWNLESVGY